MTTPPKPLSPCQEKALNTLTSSKQNVFLTGQAGSGKSFLIRRFLMGKDRKTFPVLASTGAAAVLVGGRTFHSFFGLGIMSGGVSETIERALSEKRVIKRLEKIEGFVLDEVSMIPGPAFKAAEAICRRARKSSLPWGGAQVVAVGDFAQLPPVNPHSSQKEWAFLEAAWEQSAFTPCLLNTVLRTEDPEYLEVLNSIRNGIVTDSVRSYLNQKVQIQTEQKSSATHLFAHRETAEKFNRERLAEIHKPLMEFPTVYAGEARAIELLKKQSPIPESLQLKESALVMIRTNDPYLTYVNGSVGRLVKITDDALTIVLNHRLQEVTLEKVTFSYLNADGRPVATACNFPVTLAYATTIHKAQGTTVDAMVCDLRPLWEAGQAYVALSRLKTGSGLTLLGWKESAIRVDPQVTDFYSKLAL